MNQILDYNPNKSSGGGSSGSDKVARVFAVILAIFAICLAAAGGYGLYKNKSKAEPVVETSNEAKIEVVQEEKEAIIRVTHDKAIEKIIYSWDSEKETTIKGTGESTMESKIPLLAGTHTLNIKVIDKAGVETTHQTSISSEYGEDKIYPRIDLEVTEEKKLKITATDETAIDFVTYRWNDGEEMRIEVSEEDEKKIEFEIEILKGKNDLLIIAVDKNNNSTTEPKSFTGVTKPDVTITIAADKKSAEVKCYHENGIKEIKLYVNDVEYTVDLGGKTPKDVTFPIEQLAEGMNVIKVSATSIDDTNTEVTEEVENVAEVVEDEINMTIAPKEGAPEIALAQITTSSGIKEVKLNINDMDYEVQLEAESPKDITLDLPLTQGNNRITLKVITINDAEKETVVDVFYAGE